MKLINTIYLIVALLVGAATWKFLEPLVAMNGTAVLGSMTSDRRGGTPVVKIPDFLTAKQHELLNFAFSIAKADGFNEPKYLQGIIMQESKAGNMAAFRVAGLTNAVGDRYFGVAQIKLAAAKDVMKKFPEMWRHLDTKTDEELQARLIVDDQFNIRVASKYALLMGINSNPAKAISAYNLGPGGVLDVDPHAHPYTKKVKSHAEQLKNSAPRTVKIQSEKVKTTQIASLGSTP